MSSSLFVQLLELLHNDGAKLKTSSSHVELTLPSHMHSEGEQSGKIDKEILLPFPDQVCPKDGKQLLGQYHCIISTCATSLQFSAQCFTTYFLQSFSKKASHRSSVWFIHAAMAAPQDQIGHFFNLSAIILWVYTKYRRFHADKCPGFLDGLQLATSRARSPE